MKKKLFLLIPCLIIAILVFINATNSDFEKGTNGIHQIKQVNIKKNYKTNANVSIDLAHATKDKVNYKVRVLSGQDLVYKGEGKVKDSSLGNYIVELTIYDTGVQKKLKDLYGLKTNKLENAADEQLINSIRVAYPPDDSALVIYLGCTNKPEVSLNEIDNNIDINMNTNN